MTPVGDLVLPVAAALAVWWAGTALILFLDRLPRATYRNSMAGAGIALAAALYGLHATRFDTTSGGAYIAFACSIIVWGFVEMTFLMGFVTGPRRTPCPAGARGWRRAGYALQAILYHEVALLAAGAAVLAATHDGGNAMGLWTYAILYVMRQSAKLNVFLGVRNLGEELLAPHLRYLATYFRHRPLNALFPVSVAAGTYVAVRLWQHALAAASGSGYEVTAFALAATLMTLAVLEHWLLVLPLPVNALWQWTSRSQEAK